MLESSDLQKGIIECIFCMQRCPDISRLDHEYKYACVHVLRYAFLQRGARFLSDAEVMKLVTSRNILTYNLETVMETPERGVAIRREMLSSKLPVPSALACLPYKDYDYSKVPVHL